MVAMSRWGLILAVLVAGLLHAVCGHMSPEQIQAAEPQQKQPKPPSLDDELYDLLDQWDFTGRIESTLRQRLGRNVDPQLGKLGRDLFFDPILSLRGDNTCAGCHAPQFGFADSQSVAIGVQSNGLVGPSRAGPRNQRRSPTLLNIAFFPALMWNGRFFAPTGDPFDNSQGFTFPAPESTTRFPPNDNRFQHLLAAQAHIPPTELVEMTGFRGTAGTVDPIFDQFDDGVGLAVPAPDADGNRNEPIRNRLLQGLNANKEYVHRFKAQFKDVKKAGQITFTHVGQAIAEFQFLLTFADAPIDRFARGQSDAMTDAQKRGAILFFGNAGCVQCHAVSGNSNEMFSDFQNRNIAVPQLTAAFGKETGNVVFDGPNADQDFGAAQLTGNAADRYKFRTSPLRNIALQPTFFHNGAFTTLEDAVRHHLDVVTSLTAYDPGAAGVAADLTVSSVPAADVLANLDPLVATPLELDDDEFDDLVEFVRFGLLDPRATPETLRKLIPDDVPSGPQPLIFEE